MLPARGRNRPRDPEIRHQDHIPGQQDVLGFHVAVDHGMAVGVCQRVGHRPGDPERLGKRQLRLAIQPVPQRLPLHRGHDIVEETVGVPGIVQGQDMGMGEASRDLDLAQETLGAQRSGNLAPEPLDRDGAAELQVLGQIDGRHAAMTQLPLDSITTRERTTEIA